MNSEVTFVILCNLNVQIHCWNYNAVGTGMDCELFSVGHIQIANFFSAALIPRTICQDNPYRNILFNDVAFLRASGSHFCYLATEINEHLFLPFCFPVVTCSDRESPQR